MIPASLYLATTDECADARLLQMAGPVTVSYFNEKFPAADIYRNYTLRMPGSWTKLLSEWEYDEVVVLSLTGSNSISTMIGITA